MYDRHAAVIDTDGSVLSPRASSVSPTIPSEYAYSGRYACAAERHLDDAVCLQRDGRLPNADYHFGFAVERVLKSLLLRRHCGDHVAPVTSIGSTVSYSTSKHSNARLRNSFR